jgi:hypothetical protein
MAGAAERSTVMGIDDERLERLGTYFVHFELRTRLGITFERFVEWAERGIWNAELATGVRVHGLCPLDGAGHAE